MFQDQITSQYGHGQDLPMYFYINKSYHGHISHLKSDILISFFLNVQSFVIMVTKTLCTYVGNLNICLVVKNR